MKDLFKRHSDSLVEALSDVSTLHSQIEKAVLSLQETFARGGRLYVAGNGGSAEQAKHFAEEFLGRYHSNRRSYPAIALTVDGAALTCIANDFGFENVFSRQIEGLGVAGDVLAVLSTSGNSENLVRAVHTAKERGMTTIAFLGRTGKLHELADVIISVPSDHGARVQELHLHAIHLICEAFEE